MGGFPLCVFPFVYYIRICVYALTLCFILDDCINTLFHTR